MSGLDDVVCDRCQLNRFSGRLKHDRIGVKFWDDGDARLALRDTVNEAALTDRMWVVCSPEIGNGRARKPWKYHYGCQVLGVLGKFFCPNIERPFAQSYSL